MSESVETVVIATFDVGTLNEIIPGDWRSIDGFHAEWDHDRGLLVVTGEVVRFDEIGEPPKPRQCECGRRGRYCAVHDIPRRIVESP